MFNIKMPSAISVKEGRKKRGSLLLCSRLQPAVTTHNSRYLSFEAHLLSVTAAAPPAAASGERQWWRAHSSSKGAITIVVILSKVHISMTNLQMCIRQHCIPSFKEQHSICHISEHWQYILSGIFTFPTSVEAAWKFSHTIAIFLTPR